MQHIGSTDLGYELCGLGAFTSVVALFANEQEHAPKLLWLVLQQIDSVADGVEDRRLRRSPGSELLKALGEFVLRVRVVVDEARDRAEADEVAWLRESDRNMSSNGPIFANS